VARNTVGSGTRANGSATAPTPSTTSHRRRPDSSHRCAANTHSTIKNSGSAYGRVYAL
jgi:hypothetical protein